MPTHEPIDLSSFITSIRASSVLDDDDQFQPEHLIDGKMETCWNSDEGDAQYVLFRFSRPLDLSHLELTFQGGFGARHIDVAVGVPLTEEDNEEENDAPLSDDEDAPTAATKRRIGLKSVALFASQDASSTQSFTFSAKGVSAVKVVFTDMADMFGRVILYNLNLFGNPSA